MAQLVRPFRMRTFGLVPSLRRPLLLLGRGRNAESRARTVASVRGAASVARTHCSLCQQGRCRYASRHRRRGLRSIARLALFHYWTTTITTTFDQPDTDVTITPILPEDPRTGD